MSGQDLNDEILQLLAEERKIEAIKRYREVTGAGLAEAKAAVEAVERGVRIDTTNLIPPVPTTPEQLLDEVLTLARQGRYVWAIKRYREATGSQLKEAKEAVDRLCRANGIEPPRSGCGLVLFFFLLVVAGIGAGLFYVLKQ